MSPRTISRLKLLGIAALAAVPVFGSYLLYWFWVPAEHTNYGALIEPRALPGNQLQLASGEPFSFEQLRGRWIFVVLAGRNCGPDCESKLWKIRQVRQAQGKDIARVERVLLLGDESVPNERIAREYAGTWFVRGEAGALFDAFPPPKSAQNHIYLVDPLGNVMLRFPEQADPKRMIKDLSRLLRYSRLG